MIAYEGDFGASGDQAKLDGHAAVDVAVTKSNNFFNGTNDDNGSSVQTRDPADLNMLGYDRKNLGATGIPNNATSATLIALEHRRPLLPGRRDHGDQSLRAGLLHQLRRRSATSTGAIRPIPATRSSTPSPTTTPGRTPRDPRSSPTPSPHGPSTSPARSASRRDRVQDPRPTRPATTRPSSSPGRTPSGSGWAREHRRQRGNHRPGASTQVRFRVTALPAAGGTTVTQLGQPRLPGGHPRPAVRLPGERRLDRRTPPGGPLRHEDECT